MCMKKSEWLAIGMRKNASLRECEERKDAVRKSEREKQTLFVFS